LNIRTETQSRLFDIAKWDSCTDRLPLEEYEGQFCYGGLDLGATSDLTSLCLLFKRMDELDIFDYYWWHWTPRHDIIARGRKHGIDYMALSDIGELTLSAGNEADYAAIHRDINELGDRFSIKSLAVDRLFQGAQLAQQLQSDGFPIEIMGQGFYSMTAPTQEFMKRVNKGTIAHGGTKIMRWQATNTQAKLDPAGNIKPDKAKSGNKIDGIVSGIMATAMACQDQWRSAYDREDVII
jgi:phage terminase large subunit-like protein